MRQIASSLAFAVLCAVAGCAPREVLKLHYLNEFVPGTRAIFLPAHVAVAPIGGELASGTHHVGNIYNSSGDIQRQLLMSDAGRSVRDALIGGLADAGLKPIALDSNIDAKELTSGVDVMLTCDIEQLSVEKRFAAQQTIHGQYFTMASRVKFRYRLVRRDGSVLYENEIVGAEDEPPKPVGREVFFPLETDPAESLSVALSRAIGELLIDPKFRSAFPRRSA